MKIKKKALTLLEIMIVICLIAIITGVIGYNMKGSLERGKAQKTELAQEKIRDILLLQAELSGKTLSQVSKEPLKYLRKSQLIKDPEKLILDGWGVRFEIEAENNDLKVISKKLNEYHEKNGN